MAKDKKIDKDKLIKDNWDLLMLIHIVGTDVAIQTQLRELCIKLGIVNTKETFNRRIRLLEDAKIIGRVKFFTTTNNKLIYLNRLVRARLMNKKYKDVKEFYKKDKRTGEVIITDYKAKLTMLRFEWFNIFVNRMISEGCILKDDIDIELLYSNLFNKTMIKYRECNGYNLLLDLNSKIKALNDVSIGRVVKEIKDDIDRLDKDISDLDKDIYKMQDLKNRLNKDLLASIVIEEASRKVKEQEPLLKALIERRNTYINAKELLEYDLSNLPIQYDKHIELSEHGNELLAYMYKSRESRVDNFNKDKVRNDTRKMLSFDTLLSRDIIIELDGTNEKGQYRFICYLLDTFNDMDYDKAGLYIGETVKLIKDCYGTLLKTDGKSDVVCKLNDSRCNLEFEFRILFWTREKADRFVKFAKERSITLRTKKRKEYPNLSNVLRRYVDVEEIKMIKLECINLDLKNKYYNEKRLSMANAKYLE